MWWNRPNKHTLTRRRMSKIIRKSHHYSIAKKWGSSTLVASSERETFSDSSFSHGSNPNGDENILVIEEIVALQDASSVVKELKKLANKQTATPTCTP
jgi:hypothetical protein